LSEAFRRGQEWVLQQLREGRDPAYIQASFPGFRDSALTVNRVISVDPLLIGYFDDKFKLGLSDKVFRAATLVAKMRGLSAFASPPEIRLVRDGVVHGLIRENGFAAADPGLFSDIASMVYGLGGGTPVEVAVKDSWIDSLARLISDRRLVETVFFVILVALLPPTLAAISLIITPSLFVPDIARVAVAIGILLTALYLARLYVSENLRQRQ